MKIALTGVYSQATKKQQQVLETSARAKFSEADHSFFKYEDVPELARPDLILNVLDKGYDYVFFCSPFLEFFARPSNMLLNQADVAVTPRSLEPIPLDGKRPTPKETRRAGFFNPDFVCWRNTDDTRRFLEWQSNAMDPRNLDAKGSRPTLPWLDFVTAFCKVHICRELGMTYSHWRYKPGDLDYKLGEPWIRHRPLTVFQYSDFNLRRARHKPDWQIKKFLNTYKEKTE
jgi:hypothetical protein